MAGVAAALSGLIVHNTASGGKASLTPPPLRRRQISSRRRAIVTQSAKAPAQSPGTRSVPWATHASSPRPFWS